MFKAAVWTILVAMVPIIELRGAIPIGMAQGLSFWPAFACGVVGNLLPVPFLILFVRVVFDWMKRRLPKLRHIVERLEEKGRAKGSAVQKYEWWGLLLFVAIPLPGTGAWTGCLIAAMLDMRLRRAFPAIFLGVIVAGVIVSLLTYGAGVLLEGLF